jgi:excinuclease ABC subunit B
MARVRKNTDVKSPLPADAGFGEAAQPSLEGVPVERAFAGPVSAWAEAIADEAAADAPALPPVTQKRQVKGRGSTILEDRSVPLRPSPPEPARERPIKTARGTSMGGLGTARERAGAGLMPVAGLDIALEDAESLPQGGVTATVQALSDLIEHGRPEFRDKTWAPHRPLRPAKSEGGVPLVIKSDFSPAGDQPQAIQELISGIATSRSACRCCSASPARARPSPWPR